MGDLSLLVKCGVQFGLFGGAILHLGTAAPPRALPARRRLARAARLLRDDRDRPRLQRAGARHDRDLRPRRARSSSSTRPTTTRARTTSATPRATGAWPSSSPSCITGGEERGVHALLVPIRDEDGDAAARRAARGLRRQARPQRRRQRPHLVRPRARPAREPARPLRAGRAPTATYFSPIENPTRRFFTMLGTLIQGRISVGGASISASKVALTIAVRHALERRQFGAARRGEEALLMDYRTHQRRLLPALAKTYALSLRPAAARRRAARGVHATRTPTSARGASSRRSPRASRPSPPGTRRDTIQELPRGLRRRRLPARRAASRALKADTDVFTTFEGDNTILLQLAAKNLLTDYKDAFGELDPLGHGAVRRRPGARRADRAHRAAQARRLAAARAATTTPTCSTARPSSTCSAGATSTCSRARRGG